ncbi:MAG: hypothetical protein EHM57_01370 [Actinobacteria bacterium]|nr:MAG: hypothetical protein EHM57_01370 [Actinomycetota bacterium]
MHNSYYLRAIAVGVLTLTAVLPMAVASAAFLIIGVETDANGRTGLDITSIGLAGILLGVIAIGLLITGFAACYSNYMRATRMHEMFERPSRVLEER